MTFRELGALGSFSGMRFATLAVVLLSCAHERHVFVPNTPEAADCRADCNKGAEDCRPQLEAEQYTSVGNVAAANREKDACEDKRKDCLLTCPGAYEKG